MIKIFDLDGTLLNSNGIWREIDECFVRRRGLALTDEYNEFVSHAIFPTAARFTKEYYRLEDSEEDIMQEWHALAFDAYAYELPLKPFAKDYLAQCAAKGERMALYTSSEPSLCRAALAHHGLELYFEGLYFAQELGLEKKYAPSFRRLAELLGEKPEHCVLYDDSPRACAAAREAAWQVIGVEDAFFAGQRDAMLESCHRIIPDFGALME